VNKIKDLAHDRMVSFSGRISAIAWAGTFHAGSNRDGRDQAAAV
jgi:hypothetical protein